MKSRLDWSEWLDGRPLKGKLTFPISEAIEAASGKARNARAALERAGKDKRVVLLQRGFYAWVAPEYRRDGVPPFYWVLHAWMEYRKVPYYVSLLSASSLMGSAHQSPMEYQVMTARQVRSVRYGRSRVKFVFRKHWPDPRLLVRKQGYQDSFWTSGPELTVVDLVKYPRHAAGWDNIATILLDLGSDLRPRKLAWAVRHEESSVIQRLGWLLQHLGFEGPAKKLASLLKKRRVERALLEIGGPDRGEIDTRFNLRINYIPEPDQ